MLGDALDEIPTVRSGALTREQGAEMLLRVAYSHYLVPSPDTEQLLTRCGPSPASRRASLLVGGVRSDTYDRRVSDAEHQLLVDNAEQAEIIARLRVAGCVPRRLRSPRRIASTAPTKAGSTTWCAS